MLGDQTFEKLVFFLRSNYKLETSLMWYGVLEDQAFILHNFPQSKEPNEFKLPVTFCVFLSWN